MGISKSSGGKYYNLFGQTLEDISISSGGNYYNLVWSNFTGYVKK